MEESLIPIILLLHCLSQILNEEIPEKLQHLFLVCFERSDSHPLFFVNSIQLMLSLVIRRAAPVCNAKKAVRHFLAPGGAD